LGLVIKASYPNNPSKDHPIFYSEGAEELPLTILKMAKEFVIVNQVHCFRPSNILIIKYKIFSSS